MRNQFILSKSDMKPYTFTLKLIIDATSSRAALMCAVLIFQIQITEKIKATKNFPILVPIHKIECHNNGCRIS